MKTVFVVRFLTKDMISDFFARMRSLIGSRIKSYEKLIQDNLEEMYEELVKKYPNIKDIKLSTTEMMKDGAELIMYGTTK